MSITEIIQTDVVKYLIEGGALIALVKWFAARAVKQWEKKNEAIDSAITSFREKFEQAEKEKIRQETKAESFQKSFSDLQAKLEVRIQTDAKQDNIMSEIAKDVAVLKAQAAAHSGLPDSLSQTSRKTEETASHLETAFVRIDELRDEIKTALKRTNKTAEWCSILRNKIEESGATIRSNDWSFNKLKDEE